MEGERKRTFIKRESGYGQKREEEGSQTDKGT